MLRTAVLLILLTGSARARIVHVSPTGSTTGDGSETAPYDSVQRGINEAVDGDTVILEDGRYHEHNIHLFGRKIVLGSRYVLDGDTAHVGACVIDGDSTGSDSGSVFCVISGIDTTTIIAGITITRGTGTLGKGGGLIFADAQYGLTLRRVALLKNQALSAGGGFYSGTCTLDSCEVSGNRALTGGAMHSSSTVCRSTVFRENESVDLTGSGGQGGGGVLCWGVHTLYNCRIRGNRSLHGQGGVASSATVKMENCRLDSNSASAGGVFSTGDNTLVSCTVLDNTASNFGGAFNGGVNRLVNTLVCRNRAVTGDMLGTGGAFSEGRNELINCTVAGNYADGSGHSFSNSGVVLENSIVADYVEGSGEAGDSIWAYHSILPQNPPPSLSSSSSDNLFGVAACFVDSSGGDFHLLPNSPAIDAAHPDSSYANEPDCGGTNTRLNMGAYGNTPEATCRCNNAHMALFPSSFSVSVCRGEVKYDTLSVVNDNADPMTIHGLEDIVINDADLLCTGISKSHTALDQGETCFVYLRFSSETERTAAVAVKVNFVATNAGENVEYSVSVSGDNHDALFPNDWDFGYRTKGVTHDDTFYLTNLGANPITVDSLREQSDYFALDGSYEGFVVMPGDSAAIAMSFSPASAQPYATALYLHSPNIDGMDTTLVVAGTGVNTDITVSPDTLRFGAVLVGESGTEELVIKNENQVDLDVTGFTLGSSDYAMADGSAFTLPSTPPSNQKTCQVVYSPGTTGENNTTLTITNTSQESPSYVVYLEGRGVRPSVSWSSATIAFGEVRASTTARDSVELTNAGDGILKIDSVRSDDARFAVIGNDGYREVTAGGGSYIAVQFAPTAQTSALSGSVVVFSNAPSSPDTVTVTGTGTASDVTAPFTACDFGDISLLGSRDTVVTLTNSGNASVTVDSVVFTHEAFMLVGSLGQIGANSSASATVRFAPADTTGGDYSDKYARIYAEGHILVELTLSGRAIGDPYCSIKEIDPAASPWDTATAVNFRASANDSDDAGSGDRIRRYLWESSLVGALGKDAASFAVTSAELGMGTHTITLRVVDNEGDTSAAAIDTIEVLNVPPLVEIASISPAGLIIKGGGDVTLTGRGWDRDEYADSANDSLTAFAWYSTIAGKLGDKKSLTVSSADLELGSHGFYAMAVDDEGDTSYSDTMLIPVQTDIGRVVMVAGTAFDDYFYFFRNIAPNCNWAYRKLADRGFTDEHIYYMNPVGWQSTTDPYSNAGIVDTTEVTLAALRDYLLSEDVRNDVENDVPLIIYLLGHGSSARQEGTFYLNKDEALTPDTLSAWLDAYGDLGENSRIILVLDFCYSGTFQRKLRTMYEQNRVVITSSDAAHAAYFSRSKCFSWGLWRSVYLGEDLGTAFNQSLAWSNSNAPGGNKANPLLNADNDGRYNEAADLATAAGIYIGGSQQLQALSSTIDSAWAKPGTEDITLHARAHGEFTTMWFRVFPPDLDPSAQHVNALPVVEMSRVNDTTWRGTYDGTLVEGEYLFAVDGTDGNGSLVMGQAVSVDNTIVSVMMRRAGPAGLFLAPIVPNPVRRHAVVRFRLPVAMDVSLRLYDAGGKRVAALLDGRVEAGYHQVVWDGRDRHGLKAAGGYYISELRAGENVLRKTMLLVR